MEVLGDFTEVMFLISGRAEISAQVFLVNGKVKLYDPLTSARCGLFMALMWGEQGQLEMNQQEAGLE